MGPEVIAVSWQSAWKLTVDCHYIKHIIHAHPILLVLLTLLFNMLYVYGTVPDAFRVGIAIPLVKKMDGDKTKSDNYKSGY